MPCPRKENVKEETDKLMHGTHGYYKHICIEGTVRLRHHFNSDTIAHQEFTI